MSWPGKLSIARQHFSASLPAKSIAASDSSCNNDCSCECRCCRGHVEKYVAFDPDSTTSSRSVQKMVRFSTADMMLLLCVAQSRENFWSNQYYKANLLEDYAALFAPFNIEEEAKLNLAQLKEIIETITSGYRRAMARLSVTKARTVLRPPSVAPNYPGLRCNCEQCSLMPWNKLKQLEEHQWLHKSSDNWHCRLCYRRYFIQQTLLLHLSRHTKRGQSGLLIENEAYKERFKAHREQELAQLQIQPVEQLRVRVPKRKELDLVFETDGELRVPPKRPNPRKRCRLTACPHCAYTYRFSYSHQLHMKKHHEIKQLTKRIQCFSCERNFRTRRVYLKHLRRVRASYSLRVRKYECGCSWRYQLKRTLTKHVARVHTRHYRCLICNAVSTGRCCSKHTRKEARAAINAEILRRRERLGLPPPKKPVRRELVCDKCNKKYTNSAALRDHIQVKHLKRKDYICESCGKDFYTAKQVSEHVRRVHSMEETVYCELCNLTIKEKANFKRHCESAHHLKLLNKKEGKSQELIENPVYQSTMNYCEVCERYIKKAAYKLHCQSKIHLELLKRQDLTGSKSYCKVCGMQFKAKYELIKHIQKMHKVPTCAQKFHCNPCKLKITGKASYQRHCQTSRHLDNISERPRIIDKDELNIPMFYCEFCDRNLKGERIFKIHCESSLHKRRLTEWVDKQDDLLDSTEA